jgi:GR25 family glycosyltransferase involved in LPS biosynthesis
VVSLRKRYDRWDRMSLRWNGMLVVHPEVCLELNRFDATNGAKDPIPLKLVTKSWNTARNRKYVGNGTWYDKVDDTLELTPGERGCAASHVRLWKKVAKMDGPAILVEDDAIPVDGFAAKLLQGMKDVPKDADLLYLGYSKPDKSPWVKEVPHSDIAQAEYVWTTVGYVIWPSGARKLLQRLPVDSPVDNYMSWASHEKDTTVYAFKTPILKQELPWNLASDVEHSDENSKNAKESMGSFHKTQDLKQQMSLLTRPFIAAQNGFHEMWTETMKGADEWMEDVDSQKSQSTKELEEVEREDVKHSALMQK